MKRLSEKVKYGETLLEFTLAVSNRPHKDVCLVSSLFERAGVSLCHGIP